MEDLDLILSGVRPSFRKVKLMIPGMVRRNPGWVFYQDFDEVQD